MGDVFGTPGVGKTIKSTLCEKPKKHALFTHDLLRLATNAGIKLEEQTEEWLDEISTFNINARYDNYKQDFHNRCTREFAVMWTERIERIRLWLIKIL